jgi:hypothetical protein
MTAASAGLTAGARRAHCPFLGLIPYSESDARFFFGRDEDTQLVVANLFSARVTTLFGASGVGKSSLLRAGVIRDLRQRMKAPDGAPDLLVVYFNRWQGDVMAELRGEIRKAAEALTGKSVIAEGRLADVLERIAAEHEMDVMLLLDQFEEYFRYETCFGEPGSFAAEFAEAVQRTSMPVSFLLSLREDSLAELDRFKMLVGNLLSNWYRLERLSPEAAERAIRGPVEEYNRLPEEEREFGGRIEIEPELVGEVIAQVRKGRVTVGETGKGRARADTGGVETPYLQLVMVKLWEREMQSGSRALRLSTLHELKGAREIVRSHVDQVMKGLSAEEQQLAEVMFDYLVTDSGGKLAWRAGDLADKARAAEPEMRGLLGKLAGGGARILTTVAPAPDHPGEPQYEIFHDMLGAAVLSWRRRRMDARAERKRLRVVAAVLFAIVAAATAFGLFQAREKRRALEYAQALAAKDAQLRDALRNAELQRAEAEANAKKVEALLQERDGNRKLADQLRAEAMALKAQAMKNFDQNAPPSKMDYSQTAAVANEAVELALRNVRAENDRLRRSNQELNEMLQSQQSPPPAGPAPVPVECLLDTITAKEDGGTGSTPWEFLIAVRGEDRTVTFRVNQEFNDKADTRVVSTRRAWTLTMPAASPGLRVQITGNRADRPEISVAAQGVLEATGSPQRITLAAARPSDGTFEFEFIVRRQRPAAAK